MNIECAVCGRDDLALFRGVPKGQIGVWYCRKHHALDANAPPIDPEVEEITGILVGITKFDPPVTISAGQTLDQALAEQPWVKVLEEKK